MTASKKPETLDEAELDGVRGAGDGLSILTTNLKADVDAADGSPDSIWLDLGAPIRSGQASSGDGDSDQPIVTGRLYNGQS